MACWAVVTLRFVNKNLNLDPWPWNNPNPNPKHYRGYFRENSQPSERKTMNRFEKKWTSFKKIKTHWIEIEAKAQFKSQHSYFTINRSNAWNWRACRGLQTTFDINWETWWMWRWCFALFYQTVLLQRTGTFSFTIW